MRKSIGRTFEKYGGWWNWERLCNLTEPIADKLDKYIVVCYDNGVKSVVVPSKYATLYFRPWPKNTVCRRQYESLCNDKRKCRSKTRPS
jgi:hypothetical protein